MPEPQKLFLIGLGTVARGLLEILEQKAYILKEIYGYEFSVVGVATASRGNLYNPNGLSLSSLLEQSEQGTPFKENLSSMSTQQLIIASNADIMIEVSPTNLKDGQPAINYCEAALSHGKHVVSANKGPAVRAYDALSELAQANHVQFLNEATVLSGTPVFSLIHQTLTGNRIRRIRGVLNGATNYLLSEMEQGKSLSKAMATANALGYLEHDPRGDIDGHDARAKLSILAQAGLGLPCALESIRCEGIAELTPDIIAETLTQGFRWKLIAELEVIEGQVKASVRPQKIPLTDPLAQISGTQNALTFSTDLLGDITIQGPGAGSQETGFAVLSDLLTIYLGESL